MLTVKSRHQGFTIVELLIVIVVIAILASVSVVAYAGIQSRSRDSARISKIKDIAKALELYKIDNGRYPPIADGHSVESTCGSQTENWGHCDRMKQLADYLAPYIQIDPVSLSAVTVGNYYYYYNSASVGNYQTYGFRVHLEGQSGQSDGGYFADAYEVGQDPAYCVGQYAGTSGRWGWSSLNTRCHGGS